MSERTPIRERLDREITPELYRRIRRLWIRHSIAEDRRNLDGLIATLSPDCVYAIPATGQRWEGHAGARRFYTELLTAFPDVHFDLQEIAIGPQGVIEVATLTATHRADWAGMTATGAPVRLTVVIVFPWDPAHGRFSGETIYLDRATELARG